MEIQYLKKLKGFTLLELLLVLTISSSLILLLLNYTTQRLKNTQRDKTVLQMQQIMNAALSYYVNNSAWPITCGTATSWTALSALSNSFAPGKGYLPYGLGSNPYGNPYQINCDTMSSGTTTGHGGNFYVATQVTSGNALVIAGQLPTAYTLKPNNLTGATTLPPTPDSACASGDTTCTTVVSSVALPGQNLNNARSINFAGLYYSGSCVPAPNCPPGMSPSIFVLPASVAGLNSEPTGCTSSSSYDPVSEGCVGQTSSLNSFSAFARGDSSGNPVAPGDASGGGPFDCAVTGTSSSGTALSCRQTYTSGSTNDFISNDGTLYWRVCLLITTSSGQVYPTISSSYPYEWGKMMGQVLAVTRCVPNSGSETPSGSTDVWQPNNSFVP